MGRLMLSVLLRYWKPLIGAALALAVVAGVLLYGSSKYEEGGRDAKAEQAKKAVSAAEGRQGVDQAVTRLPDGAAADELRQRYARD